MVWALFLSFFNGFQQRRFGIFPAAVSQWLGHKTCWGSAFSLPFYTTTLQMHYNALTLTSNSMTEQEYWCFDSDSSSNQSVQSRRCVWILLVMLASASSLHIQLLSSDSSVYFKSYIPTHHQDLHIHNQRAKQKQTTWNTTHPRWLQETKPTSKPHEILRKTQIGACSTEGKKNNLEVACWDRPNLIPHVVPLFISILQRFASTHLAVSSVRGRRHGRQPFNIHVSDLYPKVVNHLHP